MPRKRCASSSDESRIATTRQYNREYMRRWRSDLRHQLRERHLREQWYFERKRRDAVREYRPYTNAHGDRVCGFCRRLPPVSEVVRLRISSAAPGGYVEVRVPYCGEC